MSFLTEKETKYSSRLTSRKMLAQKIWKEVVIQIYIDSEGKTYLYSCESFCSRRHNISKPCTFKNVLGAFAKYN